ncbi:alcohol dehydrogenase GroES domain protein [Ramaria rubella]|nr:alcohol dehydrogenase GroES domain protein [Ramaria rubella]
MMKAVRYYGLKDIRVEELPEPQAQRGQVKLKVAWCGICGTDLQYTTGPMMCPTTFHPTTGEKIPIILGHEFSGTIVAVGEGVDRGIYPIGSNAIVEPILNCARSGCPTCLSGTPNLCDQFGCIGISGGGGGLSGYITVNTSCVHVLPENIPHYVVKPLAVAWYAVKRSKFQPGDTCLIVGSGPIGLFVLKVLKSLGCNWISVSEPSKARREKSLQLGANFALDPLAVDVVKDIREHTKGLGVDIAFECAGMQASLNTAIAATKARGVIMNVALWESRPSVNMMQILMGEKVLTASCCYVDVHEEVIEAVSSDRIKGLADLITKRISIKDVVVEGFEALIHDKENQSKHCTLYS